MSTAHAETRQELDKTYTPNAIEERWYERWKQAGYFHAEPDPAKKPYCITIPPPNITGSLHMGHALNNSILDVMTRWHRMRGFAALCLPGTDHAGIATQAVVEKALAKEGVTRQEIGRERFAERCWLWCEQYGSRIYHQFERLGCSYDWSRVRFTLDDSYGDAIMEEFRRWYARGLITRGVRVVNWDVRYQSAVSDIEVILETRQGKLYHFRYPFADGSGSLTIATTRPETLLGDTAVAANPEDPRYQGLFGREIALPLAGRLIPLIADDYARPEFGSGAVKVTPAHDLDDFECGLRHNLPQIIVIGKDGRMTHEAGPNYAGLDRFEARARVVADMEALGLLERIEDYVIQLPISDRSGEVIEPLLSEQWFVDMKPLAAPAIETVRQDKIRFHPDRYKAIYLHWMENIRPWCISRQLWWGHRIPIWWTDDGGTNRHAFALNRQEAEQTLGTDNVWQDEDVLDTWFSSALWPHATLGWPRQSADLDYFYPTNLLSTAQEIVYLWVARMIMTGLDFIRRPAELAPEADGLREPDSDMRAIIPFRDVYIHATVLDERGQRMSKSLGNGIDPIDLIDRYGADATRFSLLQQAGKNQDIRFNAQRTEAASTFCNKLWNAARFVLMNLDATTSGHLPPAEALTTADRWILYRLRETAAAVNGALATYDMDDATRALYQFLWNDFCDWYIELTKSRLRPESAERGTAQNMLAYVLETTLRLLHPFTPFLTEEIWQALPHQGESICLATYPEEPEFTAAAGDARSHAEMEFVITAVRAIRRIRADLGVPPAVRLPAAAVPDPTTRSALERNRELFVSLARLDSFTILDAAPAEGGRWVGAPLDGAQIFVDIGEALDMDRERERMQKELQAIQKEIDRARSKLDNPGFVTRAKPEVVEEERRRLAAWQEKYALIQERAALFAPSP